MQDIYQPGGNVAVLYVPVFAHDGKMAHDFNGLHVPSEDDDPFSVLFELLGDFFDSTCYLLVSCMNITYFIYV